MADFKSESVAGFKSESVADFLRNPQLLPSDRRELDEAFARIADGAGHASYAGARGDEAGSTVFCFATAEKAAAFQDWLDRSGMATRPAPSPYAGPQLKVG